MPAATPESLKRGQDLLTKAAEAVGAAARRLRLSTLGILQYVTPSGQFLLAVLAFGEPFSTPQLVSFACIWTAIAIYTADSYRAVRRRRVELIEPFGADD